MHMKAEDLFRRRFDD